MDVDMRSESCAELKKVDDDVSAIAESSAADENARARRGRPHPRRSRSDRRARPAANIPGRADRSTTAAVVRRSGCTPTLRAQHRREYPDEPGHPGADDRPRRTGGRSHSPTSGRTLEAGRSGEIGGGGPGDHPGCRRPALSSRAGGSGFAASSCCSSGVPVRGDHHDSGSGRAVAHGSSGGIPGTQSAVYRWRPRTRLTAPSKARRNGIVRGREAIRAIYAYWYSAFPDFMLAWGDAGHRTAPCRRVLDLRRNALYQSRKMARIASRQQTMRCAGLSKVPSGACVAASAIRPVACQESGLIIRRAAARPLPEFMVISSHGNAEEYTTKRRTPNRQPATQGWPATTEVITRATSTELGRLRPSGTVRPLVR